MSDNGAGKRDIPDVEKWDAAIRDANELLARVESRADQVRRTIRSLRELRDAGEPWLVASRTLSCLQHGIGPVSDVVIDDDFMR